MTTAWKIIYDDIIDAMIAALEGITFTSVDINGKSGFQDVDRGPQKQIKGPFPQAVVVPGAIRVDPTNFRKTTHWSEFTVILCNLKQSASYDEMMDDMVMLIGEVYDMFLDRVTATSNRSLSGKVEDLEITSMDPSVSEGKNYMVFSKGEIELTTRKLL